MPEINVQASGMIKEYCSGIMVIAQMSSSTVLPLLISLTALTSTFVAKKCPEKDSCLSRKEKIRFQTVKI